MSNQYDHIIIPRATLKRFDDDKSFLHILDLSNLEEPLLKKYRSRSFHTKPNYYLVDIDREMKKVETSIGVWNKTIIDAIQNGTVNDLDFNKIKEFAIKLITLQCNRTFMEDREKRTIALKNNGCLDSEIINDEEKSVRYFQENLMLTINEEITKQYENFKSTIMFINDDDFNFILPPTHFIGLDNFARIILSPKISIGLYPNDQAEVPKLYQVKKDEAVSLVARSLECALEMPDGYKELIGIEKDLALIKNNICLIKSTVKVDYKKNSITLSPENGSFRISYDNIFEFIIIVNYLYPNCKNIVFDKKAFESETDVSKIEWEFMDKYGHKFYIKNLGKICPLKINVKSMWQPPK